MPGLIRLQLLGPIRVERDGVLVRGFESRKALALLGYLVLRGQAIARSHLADLFWPNLPESRGRSNLSVVLHNLTKLLPAAIASERHMVRFVRSPAVWADVLAFDEMAAVGSIDGLTGAVELYRDEFMAALYLDDCPDFELWVIRERERWHERVAGLLRELIGRHIADGADEAALGCASRLLELDPLQEEAHRQMMALLARTGQRGAAMAQYEACQRLLADELGVEPTAETTALYERILGGLVEERKAPDGATSAGMATNLPLALTSFVGRERELAALDERLADPACRLLTLVGQGGVGKTRLALEVAGRRGRLYRDGAWLVRLAAVATPELMVAAVADAVGLVLSGDQDPRRQLLDHLARRRLLIILDGFEHLLEGAELALDILSAAPLVQIVVTSRQRLDFQAEWLLQVDGLDHPTNGHEDLRDFDACRLFMARARQIDDRLALKAAARYGIAEICRLVDGLPLAIELAASQVGHVTCERLALDVARSLDVLATTSRDVPARHRSLRAVFDQSWALLSVPEQTVFAAVSVFRSGFSAEAAAEIAGATPDLLHRLQSKFFLAGGADGRYEVHEQLRHFGLEQLAAMEGADASAATQLSPPMTSSDQPDTWTLAGVRRRHAAYYSALAEAARPHLEGPEQSAWLKRLATEHDNLDAALAWCIQAGDAELGLGLAADLARYWEMSGRFQEGRRRIGELLALPGAHSSTVVRARALATGGALAEEQGDYPAARAAHEESLAIRRELGDTAGIAECLNNLGNVADFQGDYGRAQALYEESLSLRRELGQPWPVASTLNNLGNVALAQGHYDAARPFYAESLALFRKIGGEWAIAVTLNNLGLVAAELGEYAAARPLLEESLALARQIEDRQGVADALQNLGDIACRQGELADARAMHTESLGLRRELGNRHGVAASLESLASLVRTEGDCRRAVRLLGAAAALREVIHAPRFANETQELEAEIQALRAALGETEFAAAWSVGEALGTEDAVVLALAGSAEVTGN